MRMKRFAKRFAVIITILAMFTYPAYSADDDSTPYMPYPELPKTETSKPAPKKKAPVKKSAPKKKTPAKKPAPKKTSAKRTAPARPSSLQQAISLINQGRYKEAKPYLLTAINANKNDPNVWYWYGVWHEKLGCFHEAQYYYTKALKINPSFDPLSRVAYYPDDPDKIPLWDPKRPARVYPVETGGRNFTRVPAMARDATSFPEAPNDPVIPRVPVYTPPEPGSTPLEGDSWNPAVYVPPSPNNPYVPEGAEPVYMPPQGPVEAEHRESIEIDIAQRQPDTTEPLYDRDRIIRADLPLYTPPAPGQKVTPPPAPEPKVTEQPKKSSGNAQPKQPAVPRRVVRQQKNTSTRTSQPRTQTVRQNNNTNRNTQTQRRNTQSRTASSDVRPVQPQTQRQQPSRPSQPNTQRQPQRQREVQPVQPQTRREPEVQQPQRQPQTQRQREFLPPVGQFAPDPGTISETPIPPVGQGDND